MSQPAHASIHVPAGADGRPAVADAGTAVHWLPFGIAYDGPVAATDQYFVPQQQEQQPAAAASGPAPSSSGALGPLQTASFRGRRLAGATKQLPPGYTGLVLRPDTSSSSHGSDAEQRSWHAAASFQQLCVWNHDHAPAAADWHVRCIDWLGLAAQVHAPITPAQVDEELARMRAAGLVPEPAAAAAGQG